MRAETNQIALREMRGTPPRRSLRSLVSLSPGSDWRRHLSSIESDLVRDVWRLREWQGAAGLAAVTAIPHYEHIVAADSYETVSSSGLFGRTWMISMRLVAPSEFRDGP